MQAILTKFIPATNFKGSRLKASCERGSVTISYPDELSMGEKCHRAAAYALIFKFKAEDFNHYGKKVFTKNYSWNRPFVSGGLPDGTWAHVFTERA